MDTSETIVVHTNALKAIIVGHDPAATATFRDALLARGWLVTVVRGIADIPGAFAEMRPDMAAVFPEQGKPWPGDTAARIRALRGGREVCLLAVMPVGNHAGFMAALDAGYDDFIATDIEPGLAAARLTVIEKRIRERKEHSTTRFQLRHAQAMESVATLARGMAHDINNSLGPIIGYTQLVQRAFEPGEKNHDRLEAVLRSCQRAKQLVDQVLTFSRIGRISKSPVSLADVANHSLTAIRPMIGPECELVCDVPKDIGRIDGDQRSLVEMLVNLMTNAVEACHGVPGSRVSLAMTRIQPDEKMLAEMRELGEGEHAVITVSDNGIGIPPENLGRVFEPFFTTKDVQRITGMGLAVVLGVARSHGGMVDLKSKPGEGTRVRVWLPVNDPVPEPAGASDRPQPPRQQP